MGFKFRKSIKVAPGVKINLSSKGVGMSVGGKGARVSVGPSGTRLTSSIPGTGFSYEKRISNKKRKATQSNSSQQYQQQYYPGTCEVTPFQTKDNKLNHGARKLMIPFFILMSILSVIFFFLMEFWYAIPFALIAFFCYKNIRVPQSAICPACNKENIMLFKHKKIKCLKCRSTLILKKD
ncbi:DUF4236 domain-containing protein [Bacillus cereus group sp. Sample62]|uniref:DUF4236 domain-containing protein n=1 Tax=unclassified Bacillus cereus group TaxID=2750818 RepID=UPI0001A11A82|nr:DUF4236 domain-containing protein [Bacillus cereus group sp. BfR-BA-01324]EEL78975.1 hypothetical protein bcere0028_53980 [Bacillus cereus AH1271]HDR4727353.1 DUF4236 domain-containing protein [Bacillus cereus]